MVRGKRQFLNYSVMKTDYKLTDHLEELLEDTLSYEGHVPIVPEKVDHTFVRALNEALRMFYIDALITSSPDNLEYKKGLADTAWIIQLYLSDILAIKVDEETKE